MVVKRCICGKLAYYGFVNQSDDMPKYCTKCKMPGMENLTAKRCEDESCRLHPAYGFKWRPATRCKAHKLPGMINRSSAKCKKCSLFASYNFEGEKTRIYCKAHKKVGMINLNRHRKRQKETTEQKFKKEIGDLEEWSKQIDQMIDKIDPNTLLKPPF